MANTKRHSIKKRFHLMSVPTDDEGSCFWFVYDRKAKQSHQALDYDAAIELLSQLRSVQAGREDELSEQ